MKAVSGKIRPLIYILFSMVMIASAVAKPKTRNVIFITLDGLRWQELFTGADSTKIFDKTITKDSANVVNAFWDLDENVRRKKLMPFLWGQLEEKGQIHGNANKGSVAKLKNPYWFSYPGYSELLLGFVDSTQDSNERKNNPNVTVLEYINHQPGFRNKVAAFCSWDVFDYIINEERSGLLVSSGLESFDPSYDQEMIDRYYDLMHDIPVYWGSVRYDVFTFYMAFDYLKKEKPRVLYIAFDETDEYAHEGKYDKYLMAANRVDRYIGKLWGWIQSHSRYRDKTTLIMTTDHGRGDVPYENWRHHGEEYPGADDVWFAILGPDTPSKGEAVDSNPLYSSQVAGTICSLLGLSYPPTQADEAMAPVFK